MEPHDYFKVAFGPSDGILMYVGENGAYKVYGFGCGVLSVSKIPSKFSLEGTIKNYQINRNELDAANRTEIRVDSLIATQFDESILPLGPRYRKPQLDGFTTFVKHGDVVFVFTGLSWRAKRSNSRIYIE